MRTPILLCILGFVIAGVAHIVSKIAERRARQSYRELIGGDAELPRDGWQEVQPLAGRWGCLIAVMEFLRGIGVALAVGAVLYLTVGT